MIQRIKNKLYRLARRFFRFNDDLTIVIVRSWSTDTVIGIKGWIKTTSGAVDKMEVTVNNVTTPVTYWHDFVEKKSTSSNSTPFKKHSFHVQVPRIAQHHATFNITQNGKTRTRNITFTGKSPTPPTEYLSGDNIFMYLKLVHELCLQEAQANVLLFRKQLPIQDLTTIPMLTQIL